MLFPHFKHIVVKDNTTESIYYVNPDCDLIIRIICERYKVITRVILKVETPSLDLHIFTEESIDSIFEKMKQADNLLELLSIINSCDRTSIKHARNYLEPRYGLI